jgi:hypothetical protein
MFPRITKQAYHVVIVQRVKRLPAIPAGADQSRRTQEAQLVGHGGFGDADQRGEVAHTPFPMGQRVEDPHPGGVGQELEDLGHRLQRDAVEQTGADAVECG